MEQLAPGGPPPRLFGYEIPGGEPQPARHILQELARLLSPGSRPFPRKLLWQELGQENPVFLLPSDLPAPARGIRMIPGQGQREKFSSGMNGCAAENRTVKTSVELLLVDRTFGTEELSTLCRTARSSDEEPCLLLSTLLGARLGLQNGDQVTLSLDKGPLTVAVDLNDRQARG